MTKKEFLDTLYGQLSDQLSSDTAFAHTEYYRNYIEEELRKGKSEQEILQALGDPRLIAKTLIDTEAEPPRRSPDSHITGSTDSSSGTGSSTRRSYRLDLTTWYGKLIVILAAAAVLALLFVALSFLIPVVLIAGAVLCLISWFRKRH